jgi:REP element-mobilizing transposase RayT
MVGKEPPRRKSQRLEGFDYAEAGTYFVTICTTGRACILGRVRGAAVDLSPIGEAVRQVWQEELPQRFPTVELDAFVVMPNHVHAIVSIRDAGSLSLGRIVQAFKSLSADRTRAQRGRPRDRGMWQRGYHDRIVRTPTDLDRIRQYIADNPARWAEDRENPDAVSGPSAPHW